jgi:ectoine hydroxylase-related dioxygenase (phytanoyl-CoA dioxygenase family)
MAVLSATDIDGALAAIDRDGYVVFKGVVDREQLGEFADHLHDEFRRAKDAGELFEGGGSMSGHLNCFPGERSRFIFDAVREFGIVDIVRAFRPDSVDRLRATTNYNLPGSIVQHFHSDGLYTEAFLICNVAVVDTDLTNGAIDMIPGTHRRFYKFWQYAVQRKFREHRRECMEAGDVLLRISTVWHRGMPNHSTVPRPMMSLTFGEASAPAGDPFEGNGGRPEFTPNWYGTDKLSQIRERFFVRVPYSYSAMRFARSLVGNKGYSSW